MKRLRAVENEFGGARKSAEQFQGATKGIGDAAKQAGKGAEQGSKGLGQFASSLVRIAKYRLIRTVLKELTAAFREGLTNLYNYSNGLAGEGHRIAAAMDSMATRTGTLKNQLGSAWGEILAALIPVINQIVSWLTVAANALSQFFAALGGNSKYYKAVDASQKWAKATAGGAKAAKEWRNQLMGFDEINRLDAPSEPSGGGGGGAADAVDNAFEYTDISDGMKKLADTIKENLPLIELAAGASFLALGAILTFSGANIGLGLALMAIGAAGLAMALKEDWSAVPPKVQEAVFEILAVVSSGLLAIGAMLVFSGANIPLGLGLMVAGLATGVSMALAWDKLPAEIQNKVNDIMAIVSASLLVLGVVFLFTGNIPLGLGLILAGGLTIVSSVALNWDGLKNKLKETWDGIKNWWNTNVKKYFTKEYWQEKINNMFNITPPHIPMPHFEITWEPAGPLASFFGFDSVPHIGVNFYAAGGFPEDGLFMANHGELVGKFSNGNTAVANNEQIIAGIERGVYNAMSSVMSNQNNGDREIRVYLDGKQLTNVVTKNQMNLSRATGVAY